MENARVREVEVGVRVEFGVGIDMGIEVRFGLKILLRLFQISQRSFYGFVTSQEKRVLGRIA